MSDQSEREHWISTTFLKRRWTYAETLLWVAYRSSSAMADWLMDAEKDSGGGAGFVAALVCIALTKEPYPVVDRRPDLAIDLALLNGSLTATGCKTTAAVLTGNPLEMPRALIPAEEWEDIKLADAPGALKHLIVALPKSHLPGTHLWTGFWTGVMFDRESIDRAFPGQTIKPSARGEREAERDLRQLAKDYQSGGPVPVGTHWREAAESTFGISARAARRAWDRAAADFPALASSAGKPRPRRQG